MYITQQCDGTPAGTTTIPPKKAIDQQQSAIYAENCFPKFDTKGNLIDTSKHSDDKIVLGYTYDGLPFQIIVDGAYGLDNTQRQKFFKFIDDSVSAHIDQYARDLADTTKNEQAVTYEFIKQVNAKREDRIHFTMAIAVTYERDGQLKCAGFGIGNNAIVLRRKTGQIEQLVTNNKYNNDNKDAFDNYTFSRFDTPYLIARNSFFTTTVQEQDELVAYTSLPKEREESASQFCTKIIHQDKTFDIEDIQKFKLCPPKRTSPLFTALVEERSTIYEQRKQNKTARGDDASFGQIFVPNPELRNKLKQAQICNLITLVDTSTQADIKAKANAVVNALHTLLNNGADAELLTTNIQLTNQLLSSKPGQERQQIVEKYMRAAQQAEGKASRAWQALGIAMAVLGAAVAACGVTIGLCTGGSGLIAGSGIAVAGTALFSIGVSVFFRNKTSGLSKAMEDLAVAVNTEPKH